MRPTSAIALLAILALSAQSAAVAAASVRSARFSAVADPHDATPSKRELGRIFSSKSRYPQSGTAAERVEIPDNCSLRQVHLYGRHGTRFPGEENIVQAERLAEIVALRRNSSRVPNWLKVWKPAYTVEEESMLVARGERETFEIGLRTAARFADLVRSGSYNPKYYDLSSSASARSAQSASSFAAGLFSPEPDTCGFKPTYVTTREEKTDILITPYKACKKWSTTVKGNPLVDAEIRAVQNRFVPAVRRRLNAKLGFSTDGAGPGFTDDDIIAAWDVCSFEVALSDIENQWCSLFTENELRMFEYAADLEDWWKNGYKFDITTKLSCRAITDVVESFDAALASQGKAVKFVARFGHSSSIVLLTTLLGLFKDSEPLHANATDAFINSRQFRMSSIAPFAGNVDFSLYDCSSSRSPFVMVHVNEKAVSIPACDDRKQCDLDRFKEIFAHAIGCDFEEQCKV